MKAKQLITMLGLALVAVLAFSAVGAASASAEGPVWIVLLLNPEELMVLAAGETEEFLSDGENFVLDAPNGNIVCLTEQDKGLIIGGNPGTDLATIEFLHCFVEGHEECLAGNLAAPEDDTIDVEVRTVLVYPDPLGPNDEEALDAFFPDNETTGSDTFVTFTIKEDKFGACPIGFGGQKVNVVASGTEVTAVGEVLFDKRCGVLAWVGWLNASNVFELTVSGQEVLVGALNSEGTPTEAIILNANVELIVCKLEVTGFFAGEALELGISHIDLVSGDEFGWEL